MKHAVRNTLLIFLAVASSLPYALAAPKDWQRATIVLVTYGEIPRRAVLLYFGDADNNVVPLMNDKQIESQLTECGFGTCEGLLSLIDRQTCSNGCAVTSTVWYSRTPNKGEIEVRWHDGGVSDVYSVPDIAPISTWVSGARWTTTAEMVANFRQLLGDKNWTPAKGDDWATASALIAKIKSNRMIAEAQNEALLAGQRDRCLKSLKAGNKKEDVLRCGQPEHIKHDLRSEMLIYPGEIYVFIDKETNKVEDVQWDE